MRNMTLNGVIRSGRRNVGSKQEHTGYSLIASDGKNVALYHPADNPFTHSTLAPYEGHSVEVLGDFDDRDNVFVVQEVRQLD